jgi:hypothetical protein
MLPYQEGSKTQTFTASLSRITFDDNGYLMRGLLAQLRQDLTSKVLQ